MTDHSPACDRNHWLDCEPCSACGLVAIPSTDGTGLWVVCETCHGTGGWRCPGCAATDGAERTRDKIGD
jgi:hypothetical protein